MSASKLTSAKRREAGFQSFLGVLMLLIGVVTLYPFLNVAAISLNEAYDTIKGGIYVWPRKFTLVNYAEIFKTETLLTAFKNSVLRTLTGTALGLLFTSMLAYTLSRREFVARRLFSMMLAFTMYCSGGMIPSYILMRNLGLFNTFWVYLLPGLIGAWNVFVMRSFMDGLPASIQESAFVDGANDLRVFSSIVLPLCKPVLATVSLLIAVGHWNSWFDAYLYNNRNAALTLLQYELQKILIDTTVQMNMSSSDVARMAEGMPVVKVTPEALKMAMTMVATIPILMVYPFLQRYFVSGLTLGAVKS